MLFIVFAKILFYLCYYEMAKKDLLTLRQIYYQYTCSLLFYWFY